MERGYYRVSVNGIVCVQIHVCARRLRSSQTTPPSLLRHSMTRCGCPAIGKGGKNFEIQSRSVTPTSEYTSSRLSCCTTHLLTLLPCVLSKAEQTARCPSKAPQTRSRTPWILWPRRCRKRRLATRVLRARRRTCCWTRLRARRSARVSSRRGRRRESARPRRQRRLPPSRPRLHPRRRREVNRRRRPS